jgi:hypothetical protein
MRVMLVPPCVRPSPRDDFLWGRLITCGRLAIGQLPLISDTVCGLPLCGAGWQGYPLDPADLGCSLGPSRSAPPPRVMATLPLSGPAQAIGKGAGDKIAGATKSPETFARMIAMRFTHDHH